MEKLQEENDNKVFIIYMKGISIFFIISLLLILILSMILSFTNIKESIINPGIIFISMISILISAFFISKTRKKKGIVNGAIFGSICMLLLYILSSFINMDFKLTLNSILMIMLGILGGVIGGIFGVNSK